MYHLNGHSSVKSLEITLPVCLKSGHYKCCTFFVCVMWRCLHIESYICFFCIYIPVDLWKIMFHHLLKGALISEIVVYSPLRQTPLCKAVLIYSLSAHSIVDEEEYLVTPVWELVPLPFFFFSSISWLQYKFWLTTLCANHTQWTFCIECPLSVLVHVQCTAFFISGACSYHMQSFCNIYQNTMWRKLWKCSILWLYRDPKTPQNVGNLHPDCITCGPCGDWHFMVSGYTRLTFLIMNNMYGRLADRYT